jgi:putative flippase GtrA
MRRALARFFDGAFGRYAATSALATGTDFAIAGSLHSAGMSAAAATFWGCAAGGVVSFSLSRRWTFQAGAGRALPQVGRFLFVWATSALLNSTGVPVLLGFLGSFSVAWGFVRAAVYLGWNYPLSRWFVFAPEQLPEGETGPIAGSPGSELEPRPLSGP